MAITADRDTVRREGIEFSYPMAATTHLYKGQGVCLDSSGNAVAASLTTGLITVGIAAEEVNNTGAAAAKSIKVRRGCFLLGNHGSITKASIGDFVYWYDDVSVQASGTSASMAGILRDIEPSTSHYASQCLVELFAPQAISGTAFAVANNLSEGTAATMRTNLGLGTMATQAASAVAITGGDISGITDLAVADGGTGASTAAAARTSLGLANKHVVQATVPIGSLAGAGAFRALVVAPIAGTISKIYSVLTGHALATGDATLTAKINGTGVTTGVITITQAGSAIGDKDVVTPSALNVVAAGDVLEVLVGGTNDDTACGAVVSFEITEG